MVKYQNKVSDYLELHQIAWEKEATKNQQLGWFSGLLETFLLVGSTKS